jgi:uncharacterized small protein (DUF1192 family)
MGCWHGMHNWHGCSPSYGASYGRGWCEPADWYEDAGWPTRRRDRRSQGLDREAGADELAATLDALRDEVRRVEAELVNLRASHEAAAGKS